MSFGHFGVLIINQSVLDCSEMIIKLNYMYFSFKNEQFIAIGENKFRRSNLRKYQILKKIGLAVLVFYCLDKIRK